MAIPLLSVCWKEHSGELAAVCESLLAEDFLVDCTIAAEGQKLKAHRLILSASSPYFRMLFSEESEKHPIVILKDTLFVTLKAVIDFVYHGEIQIPGNQLQAFLALAESLQIKGIINSSSKDRNKDLCRNADVNVLQCLSKDNQSTCEVPGTSTSHEDRTENSSQHSPCLFPSGGHTDAVQSSTTVSFEGHNNSPEEVQSASLHEEQIIQGRNDQTSDPEITVKSEPLYSVCLELDSAVLNDFENAEHMSGNFANEMDEGITAFGDKDVNRSSSGSKSSHGNVDPESVMTPEQEHELIQPELLILKSENTDGEEFMHAHDMPENDGNEETDPGFGEQNLNQCATVVKTGQVMGLSKGDAANLYARNPRAATGYEVPAEPSEAPPTSQLQTLAGSGAHRCGVCGAAFAEAQLLTHLMQTHALHRPYSCNVCGKTFRQKAHLSGHMRVHSGERPYWCEECGLSFPYANSLKYHKRRHTGERPFCCNVCGDTFSQSSNLARHKRSHAAESPHRCLLCQVSFGTPGALKLHLRRHTGRFATRSLKPAALSPVTGCDTPARDCTPSRS